MDDSSSSIQAVPIGCVQVSVLGPSLFNIYTRGLEDLFGSDIFRLAYADDTYVGIACDQTEVPSTLVRINNIALTHYEWLNNIGMVCNQSIMEFVVFDRNKRHQELFLSIGNIDVKASDSIKII